MMLAIGKMLRNVPFIPSSFRTFIMKECWILSKDFSTSDETMMWFLSLIPFICCITFLICICYTILASLDWNLLYYGVWSF
jgi:hypothetical protein